MVISPSHVTPYQFSKATSLTTLVPFQQRSWHWCSYEIFNTINSITFPIKRYACTLYHTSFVYRSFRGMECEPVAQLGASQPQLINFRPVHVTPVKGTLNGQASFPAGSVLLFLWHYSRQLGRVVSTLVVSYPTCSIYIFVASLHVFT